MTNSPGADPQTGKHAQNFLDKKATRNLLAVADFSTVYSTVGQNFDAKLRNALQCYANAALPRYLASAMLCNAAKICATR
jgi:hypothetical protein